MIVPPCIVQMVSNAKAVGVAFCIILANRRCRSKYSRRFLREASTVQARKGWFTNQPNVSLWIGSVGPTFGSSPLFLRLSEYLALFSLFPISIYLGALF